MKICSRCKESKDESLFGNHKIGKNGLRAYCKLCASTEAKQEYKNNTEYHKQRTKEYKLNNPDKVKSMNQDWIENNYRKSRDWHNQYGKNRKAKDPNFKIRSLLSSRISRAITDQHGYKNNTSVELLGCTIIQIRQYLESKFEEGMTWENYGEWHIDHIKPCISFNLIDPKEQKKCFHYTNLQPLWAEENWSKGSNLNWQKKTT